MDSKHPSLQWRRWRGLSRGLSGWDVACSAEGKTAWTCITTFQFVCIAWCVLKCRPETFIRFVQYTMKSHSRDHLTILVSARRDKMARFINSSRRREEWSASCYSLLYFDESSDQYPPIADWDSTGALINSSQTHGISCTRLIAEYSLLHKDYNSGYTVF
jgi:hypothetical protein